MREFISHWNVGSLTTTGRSRSRQFRQSKRPNISLTPQCKRNPVPVPLEHLVCLLQSTAGAIGEGFT